MRFAALDDNNSELELIEKTVVSLGHDCHTFNDGKSLLRTLQHETFDFLILDWELPDTSGPEIVQWVRANLKEAIPILMITNRSDERDVVHGLTSGADDFMSKPVRVRELHARINALLRRLYPQQTQQEFVWGNYKCNVAQQRFEHNGIPVTLKNKEFELALFLFQNQGRLLSRQHIQEQIWGMQSVDLQTRTLDTHISAIRSKLKLHPNNGYKLAAVYGMGYRLESDTLVPLLEENS
ncbi:response regulator transcription factor [Methylobacillus sp. Pita2]|uniref:response regulator transcription factor n=1 Tax=Methylobacillus sp. Pita2 TaxID=3383245 RepID=UPI0038B5D2DB